MGVKNQLRHENMKMNYDRMAEAYARSRRANEHVIAELRSFHPLSSFSKVLEVGCGTGNHIVALTESTGCTGWGVEPSDGMRQYASAHAGLVVFEGSAENIPCGDALFDLLFSVDVIHHVPDPQKHFQESRRVLRPGGHLCTITDSPEMIWRREPLSRYWPSSAEADIARYPTVDALLRSMGEVGFVSLTMREIKRVSVVTNPAPYREKAFSCLQLIDSTQFEEGLRRLEEDLAKGPVQAISEYMCIWGEAPPSPSLGWR